MTQDELNDEYKKLVLRYLGVINLKLFIILLLLILLNIPSHAHDAWSNGKPVPAWVKASCCGPADAHHLTPDMVHHVQTQEAMRLRPAWHGIPNPDEWFWVVDGYNMPIANDKALPSQDGDYWIFYRDDGKDGQSGVFCFFVPMSF